MVDRKNTLCLNGLKGLGALVIAFIWHYQHFAPLYGSPFGTVFPLLYKYGFYMVEVFFMLSGFGMMLGYGEKVLKKEISFPDYIKKRLKKIYPIFFLTLLLTAVLEAIYLKLTGGTFVYPNFDLYHLVLNILCVQNGVFGIDWSFDSPSWCFSICTLLYCVFYYIAYSSKNKNEIIYKSLFIISLVYILYTTTNIINILVFRGFLSFFVGVILAFVYEKKDCFNYKLIGWISILFVIFSIIVMRKYDEKYIGNIQMFIILGFGPALIMATLFNNIINRIFSCKFALMFGKISISVFLFHFPVQCFLKIIDNYYSLQINYSLKYIWLIYVLLTIIISCIYTFFIDSKFSKMLFGFISKENRVETE